MCVMIGYVIRVYMAGCHATGLLYFSIIVFDTWEVRTLHYPMAEVGGVLQCMCICALDTYTLHPSLMT